MCLCVLAVFVLIISVRCAGAAAQLRNISYVDLDRFSSHRRVSHMDLGPLSPTSRPLQPADGKAGY